MSLKSKQNRSSCYGGRHARKKTRKNIVVGPKNFKDKSEDTIYAQRQQVQVYMMIQPQKQQQQRKTSKKPPPKPRRLYLEKEWSSSPSPPIVEDDLELVPPIAPKGPPPRPPPPKHRTLPMAIPGNSKKNMVPMKAREDIAADASPERKPPPFPKPRILRAKDSSSDMNVDELKSKLRALQPTDTCSTGSAMLKLTPPRSAVKKSPPPPAQREAQAKLQPILPPTARPRKTKTESSSLLETHPSLSNGMDIEEHNRGAQATAGRRNDMKKSCDGILSQKPKPLPKIPMPVPRPRIKSNRDEDESSNVPTTQSSRPAIPVHPFPIPKSRNGNGNGSRDQGAAPSRVEEEESHKTPFRPVPRTRVVSKESKEQALGNGEGQKRRGDRLARPVGKDSSAELSKPPVPRKRAYKESITESPNKEALPTPLSQHVPPSTSAALHRGSVRLSGSGPFAGRSRRKKGGGIRAPLWIAPPPPDFTPPPTPGHTPRRSPKRRPPIAQLSATPTTSNTRSFILPPFQHSPMVPAMEEALPSIFIMPTDTGDGTDENEKPIELAKTPVSHPRLSTEIQFEENLYDNRSMKRKRRIPSGQNILPLSIVQELQNNFRVQARR